jgi:hypothetical protein
MRKPTGLLSVSLCGLSFGMAMWMTAPAGAADLRAVFTEIASSPTSVIDGARDINGQPTLAHWTAIGDLAVRIEADEWVVRGFTDLGDDLLWILVRGSGTTGTMFMQEGQPVEGGLPGEVWNAFVDSPPVAWNAAGLMGYSARARTTADEFEKIGSFDGTSHTILMSEGAPLINLQSNPPTQLCTSPTLGNSVASVHMLDSGTIAFGNTPITGCHSALYPGLFHGNSAVMQNGITPILFGQVGTEKVESFSYSAAAFTQDGKHYAAPVTTNNPQAVGDEILLIDNTAALREGQAVPGGTIIIDDTLAVIYGPNGDLYVRGDNLAGDDWAARAVATEGAAASPVLVAATGQPIFTGATENWGVTISRFVGDSSGNFLITGNTNNPNTNLDTVIVLNNSEVLVREGDPVDVDGDGQYDDDAFVNSISSATLTDGNVLYFRGSLRNGAGTSLGDALTRADLGQTDCIGDTDGNGAVDADDLTTVILGWGPCGKPPVPCPGDVDGNDSVDADDLTAVILNWGPCK